MFIKNLTLRNFKSFKSNTIRFERGFSAIVGPNGSGKSNVIDAIQFAFGENRVRALRAKRIGDLIFTNAKIGEVELELMDDSGNVVHKITRAIRNDGKTRYRLDGKTTKKYVIEDFLAANHMSSHNIIQQGQVQQIVEMSSKDRRGLIDAIANVSEYEDKKREAISKLEAVQQKLREAASILAEREGYMNQLRQEKDEAETYVRLKRELESVKATLLSLAARELQADFDAVVSAMLESAGKMENIAGEIMQLEQKISQANEGKQKVDEEILKRSEGRQVELQKRIDELNSNITISKALIKEKNDFLNKSDEKKRGLELDAMKAADEVKGFASQISQLSDDQKSARKLHEDEKADYDRALADSNSFSNQFYSAKKAMEDAQNEMLATKEKLNLVQAEASMVREKQKLKMDELDRLRAGRLDDFSDRKKNLHDAVKEYQRGIAALEGELDAVFSQEKELNGRIPGLDALILDTKERMIELSGQMRNVREAGESASINAVLAMRQEEPGILGTVDQLCRYESGFAVPIQVAFGQRMNYVVVETASIATQAIEHLRREKLGRVSFIPLDRIHAPPITASDRELARRRESRGFLLEKLEFDPQLSRAFEYVCGNTIVTESMRDSKDFVGKIRFVTMDGDLGEPSGLLTGGGRVAPKINLLKVQAEYEEFSKKNAEAKAQKESAIRSLQAIQLQVHELRKRKAEIELKQKAVRMELEDCERREREQDEKTSNLKAATRQLEAEIRKADEEAAQKDEERSQLVRRLSDLNLVLLENKQKVDVEKEKNFGLILKEKERKISDLKITLSDISNRLASLESQKAVYEKQHRDYRKQLDELAQERQEAKHAIDEADRLLKISREEVEKKLAEQREIAGALKGLYDRRDELDKEVQTLGNRKGRLELEREKVQLSVHDKQLRRGTLEVKLSAVQADLAALGEAETIEGAKKEDLEEKKRELEPQVSSLSTRVNMLAIDTFAKRLAEFEEQKANVAQLSREKESVYMLITEIEGRKVATFMNAFNFVNDNFFRLFSQIFRGNGRLILENKDNPFEGGLTIEVALDNKEVKYLELMSGGEKSLVALIFLFALQAYNPSSVYILDEADSALDQENSRKLALLVGELSKKSQFLLISHNQAVYKSAQCLVGVTMTKEGSKIVEVKLHETQEGITVA
jgi:chromosome segregation protein